MLTDLHIPCFPVNVTSFVRVSLIRVFVKVVEHFGYLLTRSWVFTLHGAFPNLFVVSGDGLESAHRCPYTYSVRESWVNGHYFHCPSDLVQNESYCGSICLGLCITQDEICLLCMRRRV